VENVGITLTVKTLSAKSGKHSLKNSVFTVNDKTRRKLQKNDLFPLTLPNPGCQRATGNWKSYRNYSGSYRKVIEKLSPDLALVYKHDKF